VVGGDEDFFGHKILDVTARKEVMKKSHV